MTSGKKPLECEQFAAAADRSGKPRRRTAAANRSSADAPLRLNYLTIGREISECDKFASRTDIFKISNCEGLQKKKKSDQM